MQESTKVALKALIADALQSIPPRDESGETSTDRPPVWALVAVAAILGAAAGAITAPYAGGREAPPVPMRLEKVTTERYEVLPQRSYDAPVASQMTPQSP